MVDRYPPIEPYAHGLLDTGDGNRVYWETCGNPEGKPALYVHGGPGGGCTPNGRRAFDPERYRAVLFDQRNCGRSLPHASDPATDMSLNTTDHLIADMERLREHLGIDRWLLYGGSWGSTLMLAYAERHPERVSEMVIVSVTMTRPSEIDWLYGGSGMFFPEAWQRFREGAPDETSPRGSDIVRAYGRLMEDPDPAVRSKAAVDWLAWEDSLISQESNGHPGQYSDRVPDDQLAFVRICAHYFGNAAWLEDGALLRDAGRLKGIPGVLIHGRNDVSGPAMTAWEVAQAWPDARLVIVEDSGHTGSPAMGSEIRQALDGFAERR